ncbi:MAG: type III-A CRISPR-associated RAMP protein Csm4 [Bacteroidota bacterium]
MPKISYNIVRLFFKTPLHLSRGTSEMSKGHHHLMSDTLKSAIVSTAPLLYNWDQKEMEAFFQSFIVSSAFPFFDGDKYLFPKPYAANLNLTDAQQGKERKLKKRIHYLDQAFLEKTLQGELCEISLSQLYQERSIASNTPPQTIDPETNDAVVFQAETILRIMVPRKNEPDQDDTQLYYIERLFFAQNCGLYFMVNMLDENYKEALFSILRLLADTGIGTDRNTGHGVFELGNKHDFDTIEVTVPESSNQLLNLSLYCPTEQEFYSDLLNKSHYKLIKRGGYISSEQFESYLTYRKKSVHMFKEASSFPSTENEQANTAKQNVIHRGQVHDLVPDILSGQANIWRDGRAIFFPMKTTAS